jgi:curved DNA-binding protein CbpA
VALPEPIVPVYKRDWWVVLGVPPNANTDQIKDAYRIKVKMVHPDTGGSEYQFNELQQAYKDAVGNI